MPHSLSLELKQKPSQNIKQLQRLILSRKMQQALHFLQMPIMELTPLIDLEMEHNPLLEYAEEEESEDGLDADIDLKQLEEDNLEGSHEEDRLPEEELTFKEDDFEIMRRLDEDFRDHFVQSENGLLKRTADEDKLQAFLESSLRSEQTLFGHLMQQAKESFSDKKRQGISEAIIGNLDQTGFLSTSLQELAILLGCALEEVECVLKVIQTFDPIGIAARSLQESLLIQLKDQKKTETIAYAIVEHHFDDLLHHRIPLIKKALNCDSRDIQEAIDRHIAKLELHPGALFDQQLTSFIIPDVSLRQEESEWVVVVNDDSMPSLRLNRRYLRLLEDSSLSDEARDFIKQKVISAKWLLRNILQRNETLKKISQSLVKRQREFFFNPNGRLVALTMQVVADELGLHESTIARAVSGKSIDSPRGILPLRSFFTSSLFTVEGGEVSSKTVQDILRELIETENKQDPLSDEAIAILINAKGIRCARRTVAKYRMALKIGTARQRKQLCQLIPSNKRLT